MRAFVWLCLAAVGASAHRAMRSSAKMRLQELDDSVQEMSRTLQADHDKISADQAKLLIDQEQLIKMQTEELQAVRGNMFDDTESNEKTAAVVDVEAGKSVSDTAIPAVATEDASLAIDTAVENEAAASPPTADSARFSGVNAGALSSSLQSYFEKHNPEKEKNIAEIVKRFGSDPQKLSDELQAKYGEALDFSGSTARFSETAATVSAGSTLTQALHSYFKKNNPAKEGNVDEIVQRFGADVPSLSKRLEAKYGAPLVVPEPAPVMLEEAESVGMLSVDEVKTKLLRVYAKNEPAKLPFVDSIMEMYKGREMELLHSVERKFQDI